ncbi:MAG TPA: CpsB/CapC family capsule biosynthesis tyrosine phosphatase [Terriglobia bacterium]|nr:CpsB/CapC family capsule biosynthesis tyrosine phosphatase [Terriglobia bacterium]
MVDIHCHPLPGTDDGAKSFDIAVAMCQMAAKDGVTDLVATPHCNYKYAFDPQANHAKLQELQSAVGKTPKLLLGCDFHLSYDNLRKLAQNGSDFSINKTQYLLVEFPDHFIPEQMDNVFYEIEVAGFVPILTHPERNPVIQRKPELLYHWAQRGCLAQITAMSFVGGFGSRSRDLSEEWLERNLIHFFASDAHDLTHRPPSLSACYKKVASARGTDVAELLLEANPSAVIHGKALPAAPQPLGPRQSAQKKRWFSIFRR